MYDRFQEMLSECPQDASAGQQREALISPAISRTSARHGVADYYLRELGYPKLKAFIDALPGHKE